MTELEKMINDLEKERLKYSSETTIESKKWIVSIISLFVVILTIVLLILRELPTFFKDNDNSLHTSLLRTEVIIIIIFVMVIAIIAIVSVSLQDTRTIKNLTERHTDIITVLKSFNTLEKVFAKYVPKIEIASKNINNSPISNLISWETSERYEKAAKEVWSFSYSLRWLTEDTNRIEEKCFELLRNQDNKYYYILATKDSDNRQNILDTINNKIAKFDIDNNSYVKSRFLVKAITTANFEYPAPNDISIYINVFRDVNRSDDNTKLEYNNIVVINTEEFSKVSNKHHYSKDAENYDILFNEECQVNRVKNWYKMLWESIT